MDVLKKSSAYFVAAGLFVAAVVFAVALVILHDAEPEPRAYQFVCADKDCGPARAIAAAAVK